MCHAGLQNLLQKPPPHIVCCLPLLKVKVKRRGDDIKYIAKVLAVGVECDIALLTVEDEAFWDAAEPLDFGELPCLQAGLHLRQQPWPLRTLGPSPACLSWRLFLPDPCCFTSHRKVKRVPSKPLLGTQALCLNSTACWSALLCSLSHP